MLYKNRLEDIASYYLSKTHSYSEVQDMLSVKDKAAREKNIDAVMAAIKKLIDANGAV